MLDYIGISLVIITIVGCVHFVYKKAFLLGKDVGYEIGVAEGRKQVLEESIFRIDRTIEIEKEAFDITIH